MHRGGAGEGRGPQGATALRRCHPAVAGEVRYLLDRGAARAARGDGRALGLEFPRREFAKDRLMSAAGDDILRAASITVGVCDTCDGIHINLHDDARDVFATGVLPVELAGLFIGRLSQCIAEIALRVPPGAQRQ